MKNNWKETLKCYENEQFWIGYLDDMDLEINIQGTAEEISQKHLLLVDKFFQDFETINQTALERLYQTLPALKAEKLRLLTIHSYHDSRPITAYAACFMLTYCYVDDYDSLGDYVPVVRYTVKCMENFRPIAVEDWFV